MEVTRSSITCCLATHANTMKSRMTLPKLSLHFSKDVLLSHLIDEPSVASTVWSERGVSGGANYRFLLTEQSVGKKKHENA